MTQKIFADYDLISDVAANRPATPTIAGGRLCVFQATNTGVISIWNGTAWADLPLGITNTTGTFTPALKFGGNSVGLTYNQQFGTHFIMGPLCWFSLVVWLAAKGSSTGAATITGFPAAGANIDGSSNVPLICNIFSVALDAGFTDVASAMVPGSASATLNEFGSGTFQALNDTNFNNSSIFRLSGAYRTS